MEVAVHSRLGSGVNAGLQRFIKRAQKEIGLRGSVSVLLTTNKEMRALNRRFRKQDKPTDVLSFPAAGGAQAGSLGDIAISAGIARAQAQRFGHTLQQELNILALHGLLHLAGYDHEHDNGKMHRIERRLRSKLALPDSLTERGAERSSQSQQP